MKRLVCILALTFAWRLAAADSCGDTRSRILTRSGELQNVINAADLVTLLLCGESNPSDVFQEALRNRDYAPVADIQAVAAEKNISWTPPACASGSCEIYLKLASLDAQLRDATMHEFGTGKVQLAGSGGLPSIPDHFVLSFFARHMSKAAGHFEIANNGIDDYGNATFERFTPQATYVLADASRDADFFEWTNPPAHAQTRNDDHTAELAQTSAQAQDAFLTWEKDVIRRATDACARNDPRAALYWTGYAFHGIQDLAFHDGISNAEHAWHDYGGTSPEKGVDTTFQYGRKCTLARRGTAALLQSMRTKLRAAGQAQCWTAMLGYAKEPITNRQKKRLQQPRKTDISLFELIRYRSLESPFEKGHTAHPERFFVAPRWLAANSNDFDEALYDSYVARIFQ